MTLLKSFLSFLLLIFGVNACYASEPSPDNNDDEKSLPHVTFQQASLSSQASQFPFYSNLSAESVASTPRSPHVMRRDSRSLLEQPITDLTPSSNMHSMREWSQLNQSLHPSFGSLINQEALSLPPQRYLSILYEAPMASGS